MLPGLTTANDWQVWDNTEAVTLTDTPTGKQIQVTNALRRAPQFAEQAVSKGVYVASRLPWMVPNALLAAGYHPKPADVLTDGFNVAYTVLRATQVGILQAWKLDTIDLFLAYGLNDTLSVRRATNTQDAAGGRVPTFTTAYQGISARFQPTQAAQDDERGRRLTRTRYQVYAGQQLALLIEDLLQDQAGNQYEVRGWHNPQRIDELFVIDAELIAP
jgi:hypothetical protein